MAVFPSNATIVFQQPVNATINIDHAVNEYGSPEIETNDFILLASLSKQSLTEFGMPPVMERDADIHQQRMKGRCNFPPQVPNTIMPGVTGDAIIWRVDGGFELPQVPFTSIDEYDTFINENLSQVLNRGVFTLMIDTGSKFAIQEILGDKISGYFTVNPQWSEIV